MDLPSCPACGQSVLDDDAVDCPFCGASLKGGGKGSAPKKPLPAVAKKGAPTAAPASDAKPCAKPASKSDGKADDDFIEADASAAKAIPLSLKASAVKSVEVRCRMCDTVGFLDPKHQGELVRCANPKCSVPVFKSARPVETPKVEPKKKSAGLSPVAKLFTGVGVVLALAAGGFVYVNGGLGGGDKPAVGLTEDQRREIEEGKRLQAEKKKKDDEEAAKKKSEAAVAQAADAPAKKAEAELAKLFVELPNLVIEAARAAAPNRKPAARRLAAIAFAERGDAVAAKEQIEQLKKVSSASSYELILPLVALSWRLQAEGQADAAKKLVEEAAKCTGGMPTGGRFPLDCTLSLATALAAHGNIPDAVKMASFRKESLDHEQLAAVCLLGNADGSHSVARSAFAGRTAVRGDRPDCWLAPRETAVALALARRGLVTAGADFCAALGDLAVRSAASLAFVEALADVPEVAQPERVPAFDKLLVAAEHSKGLRARLLVARAKWDKAFAAEALPQVERLLGTAVVKPVPALASTRELLEYRLPERAETLAVSLARVELGALLATDSGKGNAADAAFADGVAQAGSVSPGLAFALELQAAVDSSSTGALRNRMRDELGLKKNDEAERKVVEYKRQVEDVLEAARDRFDTRVRILALAAAAGRTEWVKKELARGAGAESAVEVEPYARSYVVAKLGSAVLEGLAGFETPPEPGLYLDPASAGRSDLIAGGDLSALVAAANGPLNKTGAYDEPVLAAVERLILSGDAAGTVGFLGAIKDVDLQEEGFWLAGVLAGRSGKALEFWQAARPFLNKATITSAAGTGLLLGSPAKK
jgi:hypothetical protein